MEMKADIAGAPKDTMFHKIYIQRHDNVRWVNLYSMSTVAMVISVICKIFFPGNRVH